ncbi:MAG: glycosyltransferase family 2 protein [Bacteroidales bacterium]|nr:glycosyltransferase family 2 protein [Bacteroidales bacterium]
MLSVLIPVYNHNVIPLVTALLKQLRKSAVPFEIIMLDDASDQQYRFKNAKLDFEPEVTYLQNLFNVGRAKVRNVLATKAHYPYILFMDCDATVAQNDYIANYLEEIDKHKDTPLFVINGGVLYRDKKPKDNRYLRWYYGTHREQKPAVERNLHPYDSFTPFNVVLSREIFSHFEFDENFVTYGNEDTVFGYQLKRENIPCIHIDNGLYHDGLDTNAQYLKKVESAIDNIVSFIATDHPAVVDMKERVRLLQVYARCKKYGLSPLLAKLYPRLGARLKRKIVNAPSLFKLDLYKLLYLSAKLSPAKVVKK